MNYSILFKNILKKMPPINKTDFLYNYQRSNYKEKNDKNTNVYMPSGKKMILWFLKYDNNYYSVLLDIDNNIKITKCHFQYLSFKEILTNGCGTLLWVTKLNNQLSLNKIIYYQGEKYKKNLIKSHMYDIKYLLEQYIYNIRNSIFMQLKIPYMSNNPDYLHEISCLDYNVYSVINFSNNYNHFIKPITSVFKLIEINSDNDIYHLYCKNNNNNIVYYDTALVNDTNTSMTIKKNLNIKYKNYLDVEYSDDEFDDLDRTAKKNIQNDDNVDEIINYKSCLYNCIYIPKKNKWKPYKKADQKSYIDNIQDITKKREKFKH
tara:strand:+ start:232 stop:1188 length:957 start_codon:yes stop_codon:yes gene_type:complete